NSMNDTLATFGDQVTKVAREVGVDGKLGGQAIVPGVAGLWKDVTDNVNLLAGNLTSHIRSIAEVATAVTKGDLTRSVVVEAKGEVSELKDNVNEMIRNLRETTTAKAEQDWLKTNLNKFTRTLQGQRDVKSVAQLLLSELAPLVSAQHGVFYNMETMDSKPMLKLASTYGYKERKNLAKQWLIGEGLVGQCAYEKQRILLSQVPADYIQITSGLGEATPLNIVVLPVIFEAEVKAVIELASFQRFSDIHLSFVEQLTDSLGIILNNIEATMRTEDLLTQSQSLAGELQSQQEELQQTNEELEDKAKLLADQNREVERKNQEVEDARKSLEEKAEQLALTSKYKSEFLANMSHELRTPLNSLLILSQQLADNPEGNLTDRQVQYSNTIHGAGADLLNLINDILDLSKIESGTVTVDTEDILFTDFSDVVYRMFNPVAESRHVEFNINVDPSLPNTIKSDTKRLQQIIKNLLSNSFKFTEKGSVTFDITEARSGWSRDHENLNKAKTVVAFAVTDTGIGIPPERQKVIFEAFQQADTGTSRKYGGAGLGLAISRELAHLLGGQICLTSEPGEGSTFTLYLPLNFSGSYLNQAETTILSSPSVPPRETEKRVSSPQSKFLTSLEKLRKTEHKAFQDDRDSLKQGDRVVLIVEDDQSFAEILMEIARNKGLKVVVALRGEESLLLARELKPIAITLDILLPDIDGWTVLDRLKLDPETRHIPVHIISVEDNRTLGLQRGAFAFLTKPVGREELEEVFVRISDIAKKPDKRILVVEDDDNDSKAIVEMIEGNDVKITVVGTGQKALVALKENKFDCMILDLGLPDMSGLDILKEMEKSPESQQMPVIVYTGKDLTKLQENQLKKMAKRVIVKNVNSPERLLAATSLFLHRTVSRLPEEKRRILEKLYQSDTSLENRKALVVDDDVRNLFAMTSVLENHNMGVVTAENGRQALEILQTNPDFDAILMDIMMPEMDGYETMKAIRKDPRFKSIPIIAVTAKAMKGDREKCLESGASDYISKPVNTDQLVSLLRIWLYK
ncbi:MAG: response regulator, partial [Desulfomonilaceae bacterium]